jgi:hypothetical protein
MTRNLWVSQGDAFANLVVDRIFPFELGPERLLTWLRTIIASGEEQEVYTVLEAPSIGYERKLHHDLAAFLERHANESGELDLFDFAKLNRNRVGDKRYRAAARLAHYDQSGQILEEPVDDVGKTLVDADPTLDRTMALSIPPIVIWGPTVNFRSPTRSRWNMQSDQVEVDFRLQTDIWLPWVDAIPQKTREHSFDTDYWDNRPLAQRHSPRLNKFLEVVREATEGIGGRWRLDRVTTRPDLGHQVDEKGIKVDMPRPDLSPAWNPIDPYAGMLNPHDE